MSEVSDPHTETGVATTIFGGCVQLSAMVPRYEASSFSDCNTAVRRIMQHNTLPLFCDVCGAQGDRTTLLCNIFVALKKQTPLRAFGMLYCDKPHCVALHQLIFATRVGNILRMEYPESALRSHKVCAHCGKASDLFVDDRCGSVYYCSEACQRADWPNHCRFCHLRGRQCHADDALREIPNAAN